MLLGCSELWSAESIAAPVVDEITEHERQGQATKTTESFIQLSGKPPPGFEDLSGPQTTEADVYFNGEYLLSTFVEYDLYSVTIDDPATVTYAIATLIEPGRIAAELRGPQPNNADKLCHRRSGSDCGILEPEVVAVMFNQSKFRLDLFLHPDTLNIQELVADRYLPESDAGLALLHDLSFSASGQDQDNRYSLVSESYLSRASTRWRARYGISDGGSTLYETSLQWDEPDHELEIGSFRTFGTASSFIGEADIIGMRAASSTKTRVDLDNALGSPLLVFLDRRSRVDLLRNNELLDSHFYDAGNQQLDTSRLPDGAYQLTIRIVDIDGRERTETQFFVRSGLMPPKGEPQYYFELGSIADADGFGVPEATGKTWARMGSSTRLAEKLALEGEILLADDTHYMTGGAYLFAPGWQFQLGLMTSTAGDSGYSLRANLNRGTVAWSFDFIHMDAKDSHTFEAEDPFTLSSYTQGGSTLSFPLFSGQGFIRARYNKRDNMPTDKGIGFSFLGPLLERRGITADLTFDSNISEQQSSVRVGVNLRWQRGAHYASSSQQLQMRKDDGEATDTSALIDAQWNHQLHSPRFGDVQRGAYALQNSSQAIVGARMSTHSAYGFADLDVAHESGDIRSGISYSANSRFNLVTQNGKTALGGGNSQIAAVIVALDGDLPDTEFQILVNDRVAGYTRPGRRGVLALHPYETYEIRIVPTGNAIFNYDQDAQTVTLYPGNVQTLSYSAHEVTVVVGQAVFADGSAVKRGRIVTADSHGATDDAGWFQVEVSDTQPINVQHAPGKYCQVRLPVELEADQGLAVVGTLTCRAIPAPQSY
ncbi:MAG: TcfC E-set like domain-containing protein [Pseudomonadales bacterium]